MASDPHQSNPISSQPSGTVSCVVETPRGSRNKYKLNEDSGRMKLSKVMPEGMMFPFDFGYLPHTKSPDGDALDVLILHDEATFPGCEIDCRLIGVFKARDFQKGHEAANDRIVAVANASQQFRSVQEFSDLEPTLLRQLEEFFINYKKARQVRFEITGRENSQTAYALFSAHQTSS